MTDQQSPIPHDPNARRKYGWDWGQWLEEGETLVSVVATAQNVSIEPAAIVGTQTVAWTTGGTKGSPAGITFHITTSTGAQDDRTLRLAVGER